jgi:pyruvate ferredoxin oxidoreductase alpha subunit
MAANADVIAAYRITPQTHIVEHLSELVADGELDAEFVPVESEHAAMSACCGSSAAGARTYTATSSQGLILMSEILYIASSMRFPIVMTVANRTLSGPISIWNDHSDIMTQRDIGWIQLFAENGQEAMDLTLQAFRIAEDPRVSLPVAVNLDGFIMTHVIEPIELFEQDEANKYLPVFEPIQRLDPQNPITMGPVGIPDVWTETRFVHQKVLGESLGVILQAWEEFDQQFGRKYQPVETYRLDDAEVALVTMGGISETAMEYIDAARDQGQKVGLVRLRLWRPFPYEAFYEAIKGLKVLAVADRHLSPGGPGGPVASELKSALYNKPNAPQICEFVVGLGGRDVTFAEFGSMVETANQVLGGATVPPLSLLQVRS